MAMSEDEGRERREGREGREGREMPKGFLEPGSVTKTANPKRRREIEARLRKREEAEDG